MTDEQFAKLIAELRPAVVKAVVSTVEDVVGREAFSLAEAGRVAGFSTAHMYRERDRGNLVVVRPGNGRHSRVLREHLMLWLHGQRQLGDPPAIGARVHRIKK